MQVTGEEEEEDSDFELSGELAPREVELDSPPGASEEFVDVSEDVRLQLRVLFSHELVAALLTEDHEHRRQLRWPLVSVDQVHQTVVDWNDSELVVVPARAEIINMQG